MHLDEELGVFYSPLNSEFNIMSCASNFIILEGLLYHEMHYTK